MSCCDHCQAQGVGFPLIFLQSSSEGGFRCNSICRIALVYLSVPLSIHHSGLYLMTLICEIMCHGDRWVILT